MLGNDYSAKVAKEGQDGLLKKASLAAMEAIGGQGDEEEPRNIHQKVSKILHTKVH